ncbi:MAG: DNA repair protein RadA [Ruminococcus sp.]|nr:DNA repair protein RadA [Ruminococcus sp.]
MAKQKTVYICSSCGYESAKWNGRCPDCGEWNTFEETVSTLTTATKSSTSVRDVSDNIVDIKSINIDRKETRWSTGMTEFDRVLGGGVVKGSLILLGGEPGIGKSTLLLQVCQALGQNHTILYVSGEESLRQIKLRAKRLEVDTPNLYLLCETDCEAICGVITKEKPEIVIIDSIQTMNISSLTSASGSVTQVRECTNLFMKTAKTQEIPMLIVGHVNKDGAIAGPKVMEHIVDCVLYFEGQKNMPYRILRGMKNRFGSTNEIGVFEMLGDGLKEVPNPSEALLSERPSDASGCCVACIIEGSRPILAEVQALVTKSAFNVPRRTATGFDYNRMSIIIAVLEKRLGYYLGGLDVYMNVVGGFYINEPAADLPIALALYSSLTDKVIPQDVISFGEIGLAGELRGVSRTQQRIREAQRLGFKKCVISSSSLKSIDKSDITIEVVGANTIAQAFSEIFS